MTPEDQAKSKQLRQVLLSVLLTCSAGSAITADLMSNKPASDAATVTFSNAGVSKSALAVTSGTTVTWKNTGTQSHTLSIAGSEPVRLYAKESFETSFNQPGDFNFECKTHGKQGKILVTGAAVSAQSASAMHQHAAMTAAPVAAASAPAPAPSKEVAGAGGSTVSIISEMTPSKLEMKFSPERLVVKAGTTVTWNNDDHSNHLVQFANMESPRLKHRESFSYSFDQPGEYPYICKIHGKRMSGVIVVE